MKSSCGLASFIHCITVQGLLYAVYLRSRHTQSRRRPPVVFYHTPGPSQTFLLQAACSSHCHTAYHMVHACWGLRTWQASPDKRRWEEAASLIGCWASRALVHNYPSSHAACTSDAEIYWLE